MTDDDPLDVTDELILASTIAGNRVSDIAEEVNLHRGQVWRRTQRPEFQRRLTEARAQTAASARELATRAHREAWEALLAVLADDESAQARVAAARVVLAHTAPAPSGDTAGALARPEADWIERLAALVDAETDNADASEPADA